MINNDCCTNWNARYNFPNAPNVICLVCDHIHLCSATCIYVFSLLSTNRFLIDRRTPGRAGQHPNTNANGRFKFEENSNGQSSNGRHPVMSKRMVSRHIGSQSFKRKHRRLGCFWMDKNQQECCPLHAHYCSALIGALQLFTTNSPLTLTVDANTLRPTTCSR